MPGTVSLAGIRTLILLSMGKLLSFLIQQAVERLFDALLHQVL